MDQRREQLGREREQTLRRLRSLSDDYDGVVAASRDTNADDEHDPEGATIAFERSQVGALVRQACAHLGEVDAAVDRLEAGRYGVCERCGEPIAEARLEARPTALLHRVRVGALSFPGLRRAPTEGRGRGRRAAESALP